MEGEYPYLGDLLTMVINHLLTGMILQALTQYSYALDVTPTLEQWQIKVSRHSLVKM